MSIRIMSVVWERAPVEGGSLLVLLAMADFANDNGICWPAISTLAKKARLHDRQVQYILRDLEAVKLIVVDRGTGPHGVNTYKVLVRGAEIAPHINDNGGALTAQGVSPSAPGGVSPSAPKPSLEPSLEEPSSGNGAQPDFLERRYRDGKT